MVSFIPRIREVFLYEIPFMSMIVSAVEVYNEECLGVLLGHKSWSSLDKIRRAIVEQAIPYQAAERTRKTVEVEEKYELRCKDMIYKLSSLEPLGDFHSHPQTGTSLTPEDKKSMDVGAIEIVISISKKKRTTHWRYDDYRKELTGVFGDFRFRIAAYSYFKSTKSVEKYQKIDVLCPFALGIGSKYMDVTVKFPEQ